MIKHARILLLFICPSFLVYSAPEKPIKTRFDSAKIEQIMGAKGQFDLKDNVFKISVPRSDLKVNINDVKFTPAMGLTSWAAFKQVGTHVMVMGDLVLTEDQVNPVMSMALNNGLNVTALHNHFFVSAKLTPSTQVH